MIKTRYFFVGFHHQRGYSAGISNAMIHVKNGVFPTEKWLKETIIRDYPLPIDTSVVILSLTEMSEEDATTFKTTTQ